MRFLCLHGRGTCARILEMQTARLREELDDHEFIFVDGPVSTTPAPGAEDIATEHFGFFSEPVDVTQCREVVLGLVDFVRDNGPFDGVLGFSEGGIMAALLLIEDTRRPFGNFACGIFFSAAPPLDPEFLDENEDKNKNKNKNNNALLRCVDPTTDGVLLRVPTAHIVGSNEDFESLRRRSPLAELWPKKEPRQPKLETVGTSTTSTTTTTAAAAAGREGQQSTRIQSSSPAGELHNDLARLCEEEWREEFMHNLGHQVPGARSTEGLSGALRVIERTIENSRSRRSS